MHGPERPRGTRHHRIFLKTSLHSKRPRPIVTQMTKSAQSVAGANRRAMLRLAVFLLSVAAATGYFNITEGRCATSVQTEAECNAAGAALGLSSGGRFASPIYAGRGCLIVPISANSSVTYFNTRGNNAMCGRVTASGQSECICDGTPPTKSPTPAPTPAPTPYPTSANPYTYRRMTFEGADCAGLKIVSYPKATCASHTCCSGTEDQFPFRDFINSIKLTGTCGAAIRETYVSFDCSGKPQRTETVDLYEVGNKCAPEPGIVGTFSTLLETDCAVVELSGVAIGVIVGGVLGGCCLCCVCLAFAGHRFNNKSVGPAKVRVLTKAQQQEMALVARHVKREAMERAAAEAAAATARAEKLVAELEASKNEDALEAQERELRQRNALARLAKQEAAERAADEREELRHPQSP